ncbi:MAG: HD domain-containing protein [Planctomycetia bacterium]|jgi:HD superfamily phosphohydrolase
MHEILNIAEVASLDSRRGVIRIPTEIDIPITARVRRIIDTPEFRRLAKISQLGLVSLVYPAALHTRFEHSLGVFRLALLFLKRLAHDERFTQVIDTSAAERFILTALLHDLGHWPFCHPIEDIHLSDVPSHEDFASRFLLESELAACLREDWGVEPEEVTKLLSGSCKRDNMDESPASRVLYSMLSGPVDIDKMDYLYRDSLHAGVPYGRNFDQHRLIGSLCMNEAGTSLAISDKGKTAAEMMVFARYVMFSEVYWHHGVRSATAMLQRAFYLLHESLDLSQLFTLTEGPFVEQLQKLARQQNSEAARLLESLFGARRQLYKRLAQYNYPEQPELYRRLAGQPYPWLVECAKRFAELASSRTGHQIGPHEVLLDAPPVEREVEFDVEVFYGKQGFYRPFDEVSPVVRTLARDQFDDYVKRVRLFASPNVIDALHTLDDLPALLREAADTL